jgi:hypothetical protein
MSLPTPWRVGEGREVNKMAVLAGDGGNSNANKEPWSSLLFVIRRRVTKKSSIQRELHDL